MTLLLLFFVAVCFVCLFFVVVVCVFVCVCVCVCVVVVLFIHFVSFFFILFIHLSIYLFFPFKHFCCLISLSFVVSWELCFVIIVFCISNRNVLKAENTLRKFLWRRYSYFPEYTCAGTRKKRPYGFSVCGSSNAHAQSPIWATGIRFLPEASSMSLLYMWTVETGENALMRRFVWDFAGRLCNKYRFSVCWLL